MPPGRAARAHPRRPGRDRAARAGPRLRRAVAGGDAALVRGLPAPAARPDPRRHRDRLPDRGHRVLDRPAQQRRAVHPGAGADEGAADARGASSVRGWRATLARTADQLRADTAYLDAVADAALRGGPGRRAAAIESACPSRAGAAPRAIRSRVLRLAAVEPAPCRRAVPRACARDRPAGHATGTARSGSTSRVTSGVAREGRAVVRARARPASDPDSPQTDADIASSGPSLGSVARFARGSTTWSRSGEGGRPGGGGWSRGRGRCRPGCR